MAVAHTNHSGVMINTASSANTSSLTPAGSEGAVTAGVFWFASTGQTLSTVKHGSGGTNLNAVSGSTATRSSAGGNNLQGRGYALAVGSTANGVYATFSASVYGYLEGHINDSANQTTPAVSGFGQGGFSAVGSGNTPTTLTLTQTGITCAVDDMVDAFGFFQANAGRTVSGVSSTSGTETFDSGVSVYRGAAYYDTADSTSETAAMTGSAPAYYSGFPYYAYYHPNLWGVMVGMVVQQSGGGGPSAQTLTPGAISSLEAFGSHSVINQLQFLTPGSIASAEAFGTHTLSPGVVNVAPGSITSAEAFGDATLTGVVTITPSGVASLEAFGSHTLTPGEVFISPSSIASLEAFGDHAVTQAFILAPSSINSLEAFGSGAVITGAISITPTGIGSAEAFGTHLLSSVIVLTPDGIASLEAFGDGQITLGPVTIEPAGIDSAEAFGLAFVDDGTGQPRARWFIRMRGAIVGTLTVNMTDTVRKH